MRFDSPFAPRGGVAEHAADSFENTRRRDHDRPRQCVRLLPERVRTEFAMRPTIAASVYLNSAPIVHAFADGTQAERCRFLGHTAPSQCADLLADGAVDAALIPAIEYQRIPGLAAARGVCVGARRQVRSVLLVSRGPVERARSIAVDTSSRTSAALLRIVLERFRGLAPSYEPSAPDLPSMLATCDAALIIGDPAMTADTRGFEVHDMAALWREHTGLPFVFALWAVRHDRLEASGLDFEAAKREGLDAVPRLARRYAHLLGLPFEDVLAYLGSNIHYDLDDESLRGLSTFFDLAAEMGCAPAARPLTFWT
jgi:chorismate dehydratase